MVGLPRALTPSSSVSILDGRRHVFPGHYRCIDTIERQRRAMRGMVALASDNEEAASEDDVLIVPTENVVVDDTEECESCQ